MSRDRDRRADLLAAAAQEFATKGFAGARVDTIAARAGVNKQLVFYYFKSKAGLIDAVTRLAPPAREAGSGPATDQLRQALDDVIAWMEQHPEARCTLFEPAGEGTAAAALIAHLELGIRRAVSAGQGLGYFRDSADPATIARQGLVLCAGWCALNADRDDRSRWSAAAADTLLRALAW